uniref:Uncharacterized protein n=1 Tax=Tetraselmis sp. GSL018 TaxID=582737 RepID=A0A061SKR8_9CHLO
MIVGVIQSPKCIQQPETRLPTHIRLVSPSRRLIHAKHNVVFVDLLTRIPESVPDSLETQRRVCQSLVHSCQGEGCHCFPRQRMFFHPTFSLSTEGSRAKAALQCSQTVLAGSLDQAQGSILWHRTTEFAEKILSRITARLLESASRLFLYPGSGGTARQSLRASCKLTCLTSMEPPHIIRI